MQLNELHRFVYCCLLLFISLTLHTLIRAHDWTFSELNNLEKDYHVAQYF